MATLNARSYCAVLSLLLLAWIGLFIPALALPACSSNQKCCGTKESESCCGTCCKKSGSSQAVNEKDAAAQNPPQVFFGSRAKIEASFAASVDANPRMEAASAQAATSAAFKPARLYLIHRALLI